ncbi:hypothetical protein DFH09DRAFT_899158, partial [Mycena vulgaris]
KASTNLLSGLEVAKILARGIELTRTEYASLLKYLCTTGEPWESAFKMPHAEGALIMLRHALEPSQFKFDGHMYSWYKSHRGNSGIQCKMPNLDKQAIGFIQKIWQMPLQGYLKTFLLVEVHRPVRNKVPFDTLKYLATGVVDASPSFNFVVIEPEHMLTHLTVYKRPMGTYGIMRDLLVVCWSLNTVL